MNKQPQHEGSKVNKPTEKPPIKSSGGRNPIVGNAIDIAISTAVSIAIAKGAEALDSYLKKRKEQKQLVITNQNNNRRGAEMRL